MSFPDGNGSALAVKDCRPHDPGPWTVAPAAPLLREGEVHVWSAALDRFEPQLDLFWGTLNSEERRRAARFRFETHARRFVISHGILRDILSRYLKLNPQSIGFQTNAQGKPFLAWESARTPLQFNLSHSENRAACAVTGTSRIGLDIETVRAVPEMHSIAATHFSEEEQAALAGAIEQEKERQFARCWTRKEAYIKAIGAGLSLPLTSFSASQAGGGACPAVKTDTAGSGNQRWQLSDLPVLNDCVGAVVFESADAGRRITYWTWPPDG